MRWFIRPKMVTLCRGGGEANSRLSRPYSRKFDALTKAITLQETL